VQLAVAEAEVIPREILQDDEVGVDAASVRIEVANEAGVVLVEVRPQHVTMDDKAANWTIH
jgi:hypothetical protein